MPEGAEGCGCCMQATSPCSPCPISSPTGLGALTPMHLAAALTTASLLPLLFIELRRLGPLSGAGVVATGLVLVMVLALRGLDPHRAAMPQQVRTPAAALAAVCPGAAADCPRIGMLLSRGFGL